MQESSQHTSKAEVEENNLFQPQSAQTYPERHLESLGSENEVIRRGMSAEKPRMQPEAGKLGYNSEDILTKIGQNLVLKLPKRHENQLPEALKNVIEQQNSHKKEKVSIQSKFLNFVLEGENGGKWEG